MADYQFTYTDRETGAVYEVFYDFLDAYEGRQESAHIGLVRNDKGEVVKPSSALKTQMRFAAVDFHLADIRRQLSELHQKAVSKPASPVPAAGS
jgi:hypothetical protein